jgi:hypothetical protein
VNERDDEREAPSDPGPRPEDVAADGPREPRPWLERVGMAAIAAVLAVLFGGVAAAAWIGQEPFLAVMAGIGCLMTAWVGGMTLFRG